jgi:chloramphenicol 3-O phosphotransferase
MQTGKIIILNGASSSGKTTLIRGLQEALEKPFLEMGLDKFIWMLPKRYFSQPLWDAVLGKADRSGEYGHQLVYGMHRAIRALAESGLNILADHVLVEPDWARDAAQCFADLDAHLIGVRIDLPTLEQRERDRKDRTLGQARKQFAKVHSHGFQYDFEVDSGKHSAEENVKRIQKYINTNQRPEAFLSLLTMAVRGED